MTGEPVILGASSTPSICEIGKSDGWWSSTTLIRPLFKKLRNPAISPKGLLWQQMRCVGEQKRYTVPQTS